MSNTDTPRDGDAERPVSPADWRVLLAGLQQMGPSSDGAVERDLVAAIEREIARLRAAQPAPAAVAALVAAARNLLRLPREATDAEIAQPDASEEERNE